MVGDVSSVERKKRERLERHEAARVDPEIGLRRSPSPPASEDWLQRTNCARKKRMSREQAERVAFWGLLSPYKCPICHRWHVTSRKRKR